MEIHTFPHYMNWDLDNLWIYNKCFQDALKEVGVIPDDNIRYITSSAAPRFIPISREEDRKMVFIITPETDPRILGHILYWSSGKVWYEPFGMNAFSEEWKKQFRAANFGNLLISSDFHSGKPGDIMIESSSIVGYTGWINVGKSKSKLVNPDKALERIRHQCYQLNCIPTFSTEDYERMQGLIKPIFMDRGIPVKIA